LAFKIIIILHNTRLETFIKLLETVSKGLFRNRSQNSCHTFLDCRRTAENSTWQNTTYIRTRGPQNQAARAPGSAYRKTIFLLSNPKKLLAFFSLFTWFLFLFCISIACAFQAAAYDTKYVNEFSPDFMVVMDFWIKQHLLAGNNTILLTCADTSE
jgi:hypothetical protein